MGSRVQLAPIEEPSVSDDDGVHEAHRPSQSWKHPRRNAYKAAAVFYSFFVFGLNDGSYGALLPYLEAYYKLSYTTVSLIFLSPLLGYIVAALLSSRTHLRFGQRGVALLATSSHIVSYTVLAFHPPYPVIVALYALAGFGYGLVDGAWNARTATLKEAGVVQGLLSASYSLGATVSPIVVTSIASNAELDWYTFYRLMAGCSTVALIVLCTAFWDKNASTYRAESSAVQADTRERGRTKVAMKSRITWIGSAFFFVYFGVQIALAGWVVSFMLRVRHAARHTAAFSATGFQAGQTIGRLAFGLVSSRVTLSDTWFRWAMCLSLAVAIAFQLVFWLVPNSIASAAAVACVGFFLGPLFPAGVLKLVKLLPGHLHVSSIGLATAIGGSGGAVFPFMIGAIAQARGVKVLQPIILSLLAGIMALWLAFPEKAKGL
ncbi:hypothetical protein ANO11243_076180 [Dothideomycetidae sp. 11243]|nr:hypothetical protein ANO11243_076180 [fungal sp. No.11243]